MELSNTRGQATAPSNSLSRLMRQHSLFFFYLMAFAFTWGYELPFLLLHLPWTLVTGTPVSFVGPTAAAFIMTAITEGRAGVGRLLRRYVQWRASLWLYLFVLLVVPALLLLGFVALPGALAAFRAPALSFVGVYLLSYVQILVLAGPLGEEPGWRGFALPRWQQRSGPLKGSIFLGLLWAAWHLPLFLRPGYNGAGTGLLGIALPFLVFLIGAMATAVLFTWVFNTARDSLLLVILLHASIDVTPVAFPAFFPSFPVLSQSLTTVSLQSVFLVVALLLIVLTRGRLGYQHDPRETMPSASPVEQDPVAPGTSA